MSGGGTQSRWLRMPVGKEGFRSAFLDHERERHETCAEPETFFFELDCVSLTTEGAPVNGPGWLAVIRMLHSAALAQGPGVSLVPIKLPRFPG